MHWFFRTLRLLRRHRKARLPSMENRKILQHAVDDALLLVLTASENAVPLSDDTILSIVTMKDVLEKGQSTITEEARFWSAYEAAAQCLKPITINSIKATYDPDPVHQPFWLSLFSNRKTPLSRKCATSYKFLSMVTLLVLISLQVYWYFGQSILADINSQSQSIAELRQEILKIKAQANSADARAANATSPPNRRPVSKTQLLRAQISEHTEWKDAAMGHLVQWNQVWRLLDFRPTQTIAPNTSEVYSVGIADRSQFVAAENTLEAITTDILPILYGLIGACFYILRQLPKEIEARTFSMNSYIDYSLRLAQGPLAGMMVSYFFSTAPNTTISHYVNGEVRAPLNASFDTLSPLAAAFLAGYSVEFIFRFIDKILSPVLMENRSKNSPTAIQVVKGNIVKDPQESQNDKSVGV